jgi:polysaccharide export outer membrane protein
MKMSRSRFIFTSLLAVTLLTGCQTQLPQLSKEQLMVAGISGANKHSGTVLVSVSGLGKHSWVTPLLFQEAIADSFSQSGLFSQVVTNGDADYHLEVSMVRLDQNEGIIDRKTTVSARIMWTLTRQRDHKQVFQDELVAKGTSYQFVGESRVKAAMGGCIRKNIQEAIEQLGKTDFINPDLEISPAAATPSTNLTAQVVLPSVAPTGTATTNSDNDGISTNAMDALDDNYNLAIGDTINYQVLEDQDDPRTLPITDSGDIEVPYLGRYPAEGKTCLELARQLKAELEKKYYYQATVIIFVNSTISKGVIYLVGGVRSPGPLEMPRDDVLTVSKAILRAGGFDDFADQEHVRVTRNGENNTNEVFLVNVSAVLDKGKTKDDIQAEPGDLIYIPEKTFRF